MLAEGTLLQNRYLVRRLIARGGMGAVYEAEAVHLGGLRIAVKETFFNENEQELRQQFKREAATLARLTHPSLPRVSDHFTEGGGQFLVMQFIDGEDLATLLKRDGRGFAVEQVVVWAEILLDALDYIHNQYPPIIHRDIKPQNLKLTPRGEIYLIDFGLAKDATTPTRSGNSLYAYTVDYASPEQINGKGTDVRSDLFSLGATLYHLLTAKVPLDVRVRAAAIQHAIPDPLSSVAEINPQIPAVLSAIITRAMALESKDRYASAAELCQALKLAKLQWQEEVLQQKPLQQKENQSLQDLEVKQSREESQKELFIILVVALGALLVFAFLIKL